MRRTSAICLLLLLLIGIGANAYQVYEEIVEDDESVRGKREPDNVAVIDSIFNIPITALKQTSAASKILSPGNAGAIDSVLKIPVTTLEAVSSLVKTSRPSLATDPISVVTSPSAFRASRRYDLKHSEELARKAAAQRENQRLYDEQLRRRRFEQQRQHTRRAHQLILESDARDIERPYHRDPFGFSALHRFIIVGQRGHGDGHVYQYAAPKKIQVAVVKDASSTRPSPTQIVSSSPASTTTTDSSRSAKAAATIYAVREVIDESANTFNWPAWFGILNALSQEQSARRGKFILGAEPPPPSKPASKNRATSEREVSGNDIDG